MRIAVVGCGSAGPAAAVLLKRQGHDVHVFERADGCRPVGAGFLLQPSGMAVLRELGIYDDVLRFGGKVERLHVVGSAGSDLFQLHYRELGEGMFGLGLHRPVLLHFLLGALRDAGVPVHWGCEVTSLERGPGGWNIQLGGEGWERGFDMLVVADGARSLLRRMLGFVGVDRGYSWGAHWFIGKNQGIFPTEELYQVVRGTRQLAGFLATGYDLAGEGPLVSFFWSIKVSEDAAIRRQKLGAWKEQIVRVVPRAEPLLNQIHDWDQVLTARYGDVRMREWHGNGYVILGDAAHAMSPQLGQGVNLALQDAACLARCLGESPDAAGLTRYSQERKCTLRYYQFATRQLTPWFQSDHGWLSPLRTAFFRTAQHLPLARYLMTRTMAGFGGGLPWKTGGPPV